MDQFSRKIIGFAAHKGNIDGVATCRMFNEIISNNALPKYISTDNDPVFKYAQKKSISAGADLYFRKGPSLGMSYMDFAMLMRQGIEEHKI